MYSILRRYLFDEDDLRDVYVDVLQKLYNDKLQQYSGRSSLATWLVCVTRNQVRDFLRKSKGRYDQIAGLDLLSDQEREIFRLYYLEGRPFSDVLTQFSRQGGSDDPATLIVLLSRIESNLSNRTLRRLAYDFRADSVGAVSGRLLEYLDQLRTDLETRGQTDRPDYALLEQESRTTINQVRELVNRLPAEERRLLELRFDRGWTARRIAEEEELGSPRQVYTVIDRAVRRLRRWLAGET